MISFGCYLIVVADPKMSFPACRKPENAVSGLRQSGADSSSFFRRCDKLSHTRKIPLQFVAGSKKPFRICDKLEKSFRVFDNLSQRRKRLCTKFRGPRRKRMYKLQGTLIAPVTFRRPYHLYKVQKTL